MRKTYEQLKIDRFVTRLINKGYTKCFVSFEDEAGHTKNLVYDNGELFLVNQQTKEKYRPYSESFFHLLRRLNDKKYKILSTGATKMPEKGVQ
ncbi:hypothetical protein [Lentibacillus salinarum]|uniref:Uncharacterized protein n=1 Tax=Lentibacillus salinarum TaxID=446820 RepID=A0ABW3ZWJ4_9BACI